MKAKQNEPKGALWLARERRGLAQKQVAYLLNHKVTDQISRFERNVRYPNLKNALMLEIILGVPLRVLFAGLYEELHEQVQQRAKLKGPMADLLVDLFGDGRCSYAELLNGKPTQEEIQSARRHATKLVNRISALRDS